MHTCPTKPEPDRTSELGECLCELGLGVLNTVYLVDENTGPREVVDEIYVRPRNLKRGDHYEEQT